MKFQVYGIERQHYIGLIITTSKSIYYTSFYSICIIKAARDRQMTQRSEKLLETRFNKGRIKFIHTRLII